MKPSNDWTATDRDRSVRRALRLRRTLVTGSVAASLAVAGALGATAVEQSSTTSTAETATTTGSTSTGSAGDTTSGLNAGSGSSQATTSGS